MDIMYDDETGTWGEAPEIYGTIEFDSKEAFEKAFNILKNYKWTSVDEALPDNGDEVLVWYEYFRYGEYNCMYQTYGLARYIQEYDRWSGEDLNVTRVKVLYWRPLPEPPKENKNE